MFIEPKFVNRVEELNILNKLATEGCILPIYIYGPEGCGKTRLLKEFVRNFHDIAIYIDALEREDIHKVLMYSSCLKDVVDVLLAFLQTISGHLGRVLIDKIFTIVSKISTKFKLEDRHLVIALDDVSRAIGLDEIEWYVKWLYNSISKISEEYEPKSILIIVTTSEGISKRLVARHRHALIYMIWSLEYEAFQELTKQLNPPSKDIVDKVWELTGGNPSKLLEIALIHKWNVNLWFEHLEERIEEIFDRIRRENLIKELILLLEDPDIIHKQTTQELYKLYEILEYESLMMYVGYSLITGKRIQKQPELGIGQYYAWQIPAYRVVFLKIMNL